MSIIPISQGIRATYMVFKYPMVIIFCILVLLGIPLFSYAADSPLTLLEEPNTNKKNIDISGFLINIRGIVGYTIPSFSNLIDPNSNVKPDKFSSPVEGGGAISLGVRFAITSQDVATPAYMRIEFEYLQRAPYSLYGRASSYAISNRGGLPDPTYGYDASKPVYSLEERAFKLKAGTQTVQLGMFIDIDTNSVVVPYLGFILGVTIYDIQLQAPNVEIFNPTQTVGGILYGNISFLQNRKTDASFLWGLAAGIIMVVNDYISFDIGIKYTNNMGITVGREGTLAFKLKYDFIETMLGMSVAL